MASLTRSQLKTSSNNTYTTNGTGDIDASEVRTFNNDLIDSLITNDATSSMNVLTSVSASYATIAGGVVGGIPSLASLNDFTSSQNTKNSTLASYTASNDSTNTSQNSRLTNLESTSASVNTSIANLNTFSASNGNTSLNLYTSSANSRLTSLESQTSSYANSASVAVVDASQQSQINALIAATGSYATSSVSLTSLNDFTSSQNTKNTTLENVTSSLISSQSLDTTKWNTLGSLTGSFATTGSNLFSGSQIISGGFFVHGGTVFNKLSIPSNTDYIRIAADKPILITGAGGGSGGGFEISVTNPRILFTDTNTGYATQIYNSVDDFYLAKSNGKFISFPNITTPTTIIYNKLDVSGSVTVTGSFTSSLQQGYVLVGNSSNTTVAVATSSFGSTTDLTSLNAFTASASSSLNSLNQNSSSQQSQINALIAATGSYASTSSIVVLTSLNDFTSSQNTKNSTLATYTGSNDTKWSNLGSQSGSFVTESETASFARTNVDNNFSANQTFTNITAVSASFTYVQTLYETSSVIYSSGSNQFGDELSDIQTLSGSVKVQGSLTVNGTPVQTSSVDITSLNAYTASQDTKNSTLATYTASVNSSLSNINSFTASNGNTSLNSFTGSQETKNSTLATYTGSNDTKWSNLGSQSGSFVTESETGSFVKVNVANTFTADQTIASANNLIVSGGIVTLNGLYFPSGILNGLITFASANSNLRIENASLNVDNTFTASLQEGYVWVGNSSGRTTTVATSSFGGGSTPVGTVSSSAQILAYNIFATTASNTFVGNQTINGNLNLTGSLTASGLTYPTTSGTAGQFITTNGTNTLSFDDVHVLLEDIRYGENITIGDPLYVSGSNGTRPIVFKADASNTAKMPVIYVASSTAVANTNTTALTLGLITGVTTTGYAEGTTIYVAEGGGWSANRPSGSASIVQALGIVTKTGPGGSGRGLILNPGPATLPNLQTGYAWAGNGGNQPVAVATSSFSTTIPSGTISGSSQITALGFVSSSVTASSLVTASFSGNTLTFTKGDSSTFGVVIPDISGSTIDTGSFATTGSNVFIGDETFQDASGNASTLSPYSGSLVLVAKGITSGSAGLSNITSSANLVNLIFKNNNANSGSLTLSGSNNILLSPATPTAGFKRYVTGTNIFLTTALPEMTGSLTYSPTVTGNYGNSVLRFRGPASSSAWSFTANIVNANLNVGNGDATSANQAIAGGSITNNILLAAVNYNAYTTPLVAQATFSSNLVVGAATLTAFSSSIQANNNIFNGNSFAVNNSYFGTASTNAAQRLALSYNVFGGINSSALTVSGSNTTTSYNREVIGNTTNGSGIALGAVLNGDNSSLLSTLVHGSNLTVTGSTLYNTYANAGSAFFGRNNSVNGTAARSGETIFAVGTGTGTGTRKTGFLIDSGSNTFVEGTLNVSGSTSFNGAVNITGSLTSSLTLGYVWVGGAGNVSTLVATSSFAGGSVPAGTISGSSQITALGFVSSSVTASSLVTASVNLNTITFTKGDSSTFAITVDTGSGGGSVPAGTVSSSAQILGYNIFATTASNTFTGGQTINSGGGLVLGETTGTNDNNIVLSSLNKATLYIQNTSISSGYNSGSILQLTTTTGSTGFGSGSTVFQMDALYEGNRAAMKVGSTPGLGSYVQGFADKIEFAKQGGFPNTPATTFRVDAASIELSGSIKVNTGSSGSAGIVSVGSGGTTVNNGLVTAASIILATTQELGSGDEYPAVVSGKTNGSFTLNHNFGGTLSVAYLIINPL